jgi:hypothetical protein
MPNEYPMCERFKEFNDQLRAAEELFEWLQSRPDMEMPLAIGETAGVLDWVNGFDPVIAITAAPFLQWLQPKLEQEVADSDDNAYAKQRHASLDYVNVQKRFYEYAGIDENVLENERRAMLQACQNL